MVKKISLYNCISRTIKKLLMFNNYIRIHICLLCCIFNKMVFILMNLIIFKVIIDTHSIVLYFNKCKTISNLFFTTYN